MQYEKINNDYFIHIEKNEKIMKTFIEFCIKNNINNAKISGIGAVKRSLIGAYDTIAKEYIKKEFHEVLELVSFEGNITINNNLPFPHAHVVLSDHNMNTFGGHLFETTIAAVGEFFLKRFDGGAYRKYNEDIGLPCIVLQNKIKIK
jgi:predicted DNA-binding protein with PD1-like motif